MSNPIEPISAGANAAASLVDTFMQRKNQGRQNDENLKLMMAERGWNQQQWLQQKRYDKSSWNKQNAYNQQLWDQQNEYNSPKAQMARFKEAGLNPHLIYGKGSSGPAGSVAGSDPQTAGDPKNSGSYQNQQLTHQTPFQDMYNIGNTSAQTNQMEAQKKLIDEQAILTAQNSANASIMGKSLGLKYKLNNALFDTNVQAGLEGVRKLRAEADVATNTVGSQTQIMSKKLELLGKQIIGQSRENSIKTLRKGIEQITLDLNKQGIFKTDNMLIRQIGQDNNLNKFRKEITNWLNR